MNKKQILVIIYRPPNFNPSSFLNQLDETVENLQTMFKGYEITLMGDLNIDYLKNDCRHVKTLKNFEYNTGLTQTITSATRITSVHATLIDLCFSNISNILESGTLNYNLSDHLPIYLIKKKTKSERKTQRFRGRSFFHYSLDAFETELEKYDWNLILTENNPNTQWDMCEKILFDISDVICPLRNFQITKSRPEFFTNELCEFIKEREKIFKIARKTKDKKLWERGISLRRQIITMVKEARCSFIQDN